jgi:cytochrome c5
MIRAKSSHELEEDQFRKRCLLVYWRPSGNTEPPLICPSNPMKRLSLALCLVAALAGCSKSEAPPPAAPAAAPAAPAPAPAPAVAENTVGKSTFGKVCSMCHAAGVAGAPKPGDKADWGPRIAQGKETLYKHALEGFTGSKGQMPAKGGAPTLPDADVKAAVDYMADQSR